MARYGSETHFPRSDSEWPLRSQGTRLRDLNCSAILHEDAHRAPKMLMFRGLEHLRMKLSPFGETGW